MPEHRRREEDDLCSSSAMRGCTPISSDKPVHDAVDSALLEGPDLGEVPDHMGKHYPSLQKPSASHGRGYISFPPGCTWIWHDVPLRHAIDIYLLQGSSFEETATGIREECPHLRTPGADMIRQYVACKKEWLSYLLLLNDGQPPENPHQPDINVAKASKRASINSQPQNNPTTADALSFLAQGSEVPQQIQSNNPFLENETGLCAPVAQLLLLDASEHPENAHQPESNVAEIKNAPQTPPEMIKKDPEANDKRDPAEEPKRANMNSQSQTNPATADASPFFAQGSEVPQQMQSNNLFLENDIGLSAPVSQRGEQFVTRSQITSMLSRTQPTTTEQQGIASSFSAFEQFGQKNNAAGQNPWATALAYQEPHKNLFRSRFSNM